MKRDTAFALVVKFAPQQAGMLWNTTAHVGCDTVTAVADQYGDGDSEREKAIGDLRRLAAGDTPDHWEPHTPIAQNVRQLGGRYFEAADGTVIYCPENE